MESKNQEKENRKNIALFIDSLGGGGAERVASVLCNALADQTCYRVGIVMLRKEPIQYELSSKISLSYAADLNASTVYGRCIQSIFGTYKQIRQRILKPILVRIGRYEHTPKLDETKFYFYARYAIPYREYIKKNKIDVAVGFLIRSNIAMLMAAKGTDVKTVFCERNNPVRPDIPKNIIKLRDRYYKRCKAAVFQTEDEREYYTKLKCSTEVIPNPLKENLPERFTGERKREIVNFCRLSKQKNIPLLIDAFEMLLVDHPSYVLRIYGRGEEKENISQYIMEKHLTNQVILKDFAADIHDRIRDATMFVSTSDFEGLSNSMLEAMAIGLPTICTDCDGGGARMMIQDHVNGLLVPKGDARAVYSAMKEITDNSVLAEKLSFNASKIREELSVDRIVSKWEEMI